MANKIQFRRDTAANWTDANPLLSQGELGYETDTTKFKLGDGTSYWNDLGYAFIPSGPQDRITSGTVALVINADGTITAPSNVLNAGAESTIVASLFLAAEGSSGTGYSFQGDGGYDTGMFSSGDGYLQFYNNAQQTMLVTTNGWNLSPNKPLSFDKSSAGDAGGIQIGAMADYYSVNQLNFIVGGSDPFLFNGNGVQVYDNNGGSAIIVGNTSASGDIYGIWDTNTSTGQVRVITQEQGTAVKHTWEFTEKGGFKDNVGILQNSTATNNVFGTTPILVASYDTAQFDSSEHAVKIRDGAYIYSAKLDVVTDGTDSWKNEYSVVANTSTLGSFAATIDGTQLNLTFTPIAAASLSLVSKNTMFPLQNPLLPPPPTGPLAGYIAWYDVSSWTGSTWNDMSGNGYHATVSGSPTVSSVSGNGASLLASAITGGTSDGIRWPMNLPTDYTVFAVSRYNGSNKHRIYQQYRPYDWGYLFGHHENKSGVAYHAGAITDWNDHFGDNWVISMDQINPNPGSYHGNGVNYPMSGSIGISGTGPLDINGKGDETSDWATAEVLIYDRQLTSEEIIYVETYLAGKYGISI